MNRVTWYLSALSIPLCHCAFNVVSPPSRLANTEIPRVADSGHVTLAPQVFGAGKIFGPSLGATSMRLSKGVGQGKEWAISPVLGLVDASSRSGDNPAPYFGGAAVEYKSEFSHLPHWLVMSHHTGGGLLFSEAGQVISGEVGLALGTQVWYVRPFMSTSTWIGIPLATRPIYNRDEEASVTSKNLTTTLGIRCDLGLEFYLGRQFSVITATGIGTARSQTDDLPFIEMGAALRTEF
jgi:hypothetical protein